MNALAGEKATAGTSASFDGLEADTVYYVRVKASTATGESAWSEPQTVITDGGIDLDNPPYNPSLQKPAGWSLGATLSSTTLALDWEAVEGARGYNVESTTNLFETNSWRRIDTLYDADGFDLIPAFTNDGPIYYRLRVW